MYIVYSIVYSSIVIEESINYDNKSNNIKYKKLNKVKKEGL